MFRATKDKVIDATFKGNEARYLNHSCDVIYNNPLLLDMLNQCFEMNIT